MAFIQRTTDPTAADLYWTQTDYGGYNHCILGNTFKGSPYGYFPLQWPGCVLPNCTGYAVGRYMECQGVTSTPLYNNGDMDAKSFWTVNSPGITKSQEPKLGAIMVWAGGSFGHVAVVEEILDNGIITWSESNYGWTPKYGGRNTSYGTGLWWCRRTMNPRAYVSGFSGYLWPFTETGAGPAPQPINWIYHNAYSYPNWQPGGAEQKNNAAKFYYFMHGNGFTPEAIAAMLGNIQSESLINPQQKEVFSQRPWTTADGYGLTQWTHATKLIDWAQQQGLDYTDGDTQCKRIIYEFENGIQYGHNGNWGDPPINGQQFKTSTLPPETLAEYFLKWYENPLDVSATIAARKSQARFWYNYIVGLPEGSDGPAYEPPTEKPKLILTTQSLIAAFCNKKKGGKPPCKQIISI